MSYDLNKILIKAELSCEGYYHNDNLEYECSYLYPFATENISGYIDNFSLKDKSLLTVGSSCDQVLNAIFKGCKDITLLDKNPYTKYYYYLKVSAILSLSLKEFLDFLRYKDYPKNFQDNKEVFNRKSFEKVKMLLRLLDYESYLFWDELWQMYDGEVLRKNLFMQDEYQSIVINNSNEYLKKAENYNIMKKLLKNVDIKFINGDILETDLRRSYDNIWLSNIGRYLSLNDLKIMVYLMNQCLNPQGKLLICYLYETNKNTKYEEYWDPIYNLEEVNELLKEYQPQLISFKGNRGIIFNNEKIQDSILLYKKELGNEKIL